MTEQEKKKRKIVNTCLTLFIGEDIHKPTGDGRTVYERAVERFTCVCGKSYGHKKSLQAHIQRNNPDFYQLNDFDRLRKWMEENEPELWESYLAYIRRRVLQSALLVCSSTVLREWLNPANLFDFLSTTKGTAQSSKVFG